MEQIVNKYVNAVIQDLFNSQMELVVKPLKIESELSDYFYKFSVVNEFGIEFTFFLNKLKMSKSNQASVFIKSLKKKDDFMLSDWLKYEGYKFEKDPFNFASYHEDNLDIQIQGLISFFKEIFNNRKLKEVLAGGTWDETPFDWAGLR